MFEVRRLTGYKIAQVCYCFSWSSPKWFIGLLGVDAAQNRM